MKVTGIWKAPSFSTCYRNLLPCTDSYLSFRFRSDSVFSFGNSRNSLVSAIMEAASFKAEEAKFKIALCQLSVTKDKERNIAHAKQAIEDAADNEDIDAGGDASPLTRMLSEVSRSLKIIIIGGSIPERSGDKIYNTCCVFGTDGKVMARHRKIHLFDIDIPGKMTFKESRTLTAGARPTIVDTEVIGIGIGICYDIRFQELAAIYAARGAHLLCYPGAFNMTTGPLHCEFLQRAR